MITLQRRLEGLLAAAAALDQAQLDAFDNSPLALRIEERRREIDADITALALAINRGTRDLAAA